MNPAFAKLRRLNIAAAILHLASLGVHGLVFGKGLSRRGFRVTAGLAGAAGRGGLDLVQ